MYLQSNYIYMISFLAVLGDNLDVIPFRMKTCIMHVGQIWDASTCEIDNFKTTCMYPVLQYVLVIYTKTIWINLSIHCIFHSKYEKDHLKNVAQLYTVI